MKLFNSFLKTTKEYLLDTADLLPLVEGLRDLHDVYRKKYGSGQATLADAKEYYDHNYLRENPTLPEYKREHDRVFGDDDRINLGPIPAVLPVSVRQYLATHPLVDEVHTDGRHVTLKGREYTDKDGVVRNSAPKKATIADVLSRAKAPEDVSTEYKNFVNSLPPSGNFNLWVSRNPYDVLSMGTQMNKNDRRGIRDHFRSTVGGEPFPDPCSNFDPESRHGGENRGAAAKLMGGELRHGTLVGIVAPHDAEVDETGTFYNKDDQIGRVKALGYRDADRNVDSPESDHVIFRSNKHYGVVPDSAAQMFDDWLEKNYPTKGLKYTTASQARFRGDVPYQDGAKETYSNSDILNRISSAHNNELTTPEEVQSIHDSLTPTERWRILGHPHAKSLFSQKVREGEIDDRTLEKMLSMNRASEPLLFRALKSDSPTIRKNAVEHPDATPSVLSTASNDSDADVISSVLDHPNLPQHVAQKLFRIGERDSQISSAFNRLSDDTKENMYRENIGSTRAKMLLHGYDSDKVLPEHLESALNDMSRYYMKHRKPDLLVHPKMPSRYPEEFVSKSDNDQYESDEKKNEILASSPAIRPEFLENLYHNPLPHTKMFSLLENPNVPERVMSDSIKIPGAIHSLIRNEATPKNLLVKIAKGLHYEGMEERKNDESDSNFMVRSNKVAMNLCRHKNCGPEVAKELFSNIRIPHDIKSNIIKFHPDVLDGDAIGTAIKYQPTSHDGAGERKTFYGSIIDSPHTTDDHLKTLLRTAADTDEFSSKLLVKHKMSENMYHYLLDHELFSDRANTLAMSRRGSLFLRGDVPDSVLKRGIFDEERRVRMNALNRNHSPEFMEDCFDRAVKEDRREVAGSLLQHDSATQKMLDRAFDTDVNQPWAALGNRNLKESHLIRAAGQKGVASLAIGHNNATEKVLSRAIKAHSDHETISSALDSDKINEGHLLQILGKKDFDTAQSESYIMSSVASHPKAEKSVLSKFVDSPFAQDAAGNINLRKYPDLAAKFINHESSPVASSFFRTTGAGVSWRPSESATLLGLAHKDGPVNFNAARTGKMTSAVRKAILEHPTDEARFGAVYGASEREFRARHDKTSREYRDLMNEVPDDYVRELSNLPLKNHGASPVMHSTIANMMASRQGFSTDEINQYLRRGVVDHVNYNTFKDNLGDSRMTPDLYRTFLYGSKEPSTVMANDFINSHLSHIDDNDVNHFSKIWKNEGCDFIGGHHSAQLINSNAKNYVMGMIDGSHPEAKADLKNHAICRLLTKGFSGENGVNESDILGALNHVSRDMVRGLNNVVSSHLSPSMISHQKRVSDFEKNSAVTEKVFNKLIELGVHSSQFLSHPNYPSSGIDKVLDDHLAIYNKGGDPNFEYFAKALSRNHNLTKDQMKKFATLSPREASEHPQCDSDCLKVMYDKKLRAEGLLKHPAADASLVDHIFNNAKGTTGLIDKRLALEHPHASENILNSALSGPDKDVFSDSIIERKTLPESVLKEYGKQFSHNHARVIQAIKHPSATPSVLSNFVNHPHFFVRSWISQSRHATPEVLKSLLTHESSTEDSSHPLASSLVRKRVFSSENADESVHEHAMGLPDSESHVSAAESERASHSFLRKCVQHENPNVRRAAAGNRTAPADVLHKGLDDFDSSVREASAQNVSADRGVLERAVNMTGDHNFGVRLHAVLNHGCLGDIDHNDFLDHVSKHHPEELIREHAKNTLDSKNSHAALFNND